MKYIAIIILCIIAVSLGVTPSINSFNNGQVSPLLDARVDYEKYAASSRICENAFITVQGPFVRRPGTQYVAPAKAEARLIPFEYSTDDSYVLEFTNGFIRFYRDDGL